MNRQELINILACPKCHGRLCEVSAEDAEGFACASCEVVYPIVDDIPIMLIDSAIATADWPKKAKACES